MLGNGIKQTTATTGTGALTMVTVTDMPALSDVFGLNVPIAYTLLTAAGLFIESGIGYLSGTATLVRAVVLSTFVSGVYNNVNPTAASLSGTTTIICTPQAATLESMLPTVDSQSASVSRYLLTAGRNMSTTTLALTALRLYHVPFLLRTAARVSSLGINVTTAGAALTVARAGIFSCNEKGYMGAMLATTADLDCASTGFKAGTLTNPIALPPGWYFASVVTSATCTVTAYSSALANLNGGAPLGFSTASPPIPIDYRHETLGSAVLPTTANTTTTASLVGSTHTPVVYVGAQ